MPRVLLMAATAGYQTRSFTAAARRLGIEVILATGRCHILEDPWRDNAIPVRFEEPELAAETLAGSAVVGKSAIDGVIAVADRPTLVAALTAQKLGIPFHSPHSVAGCRDKHKMREIFGLAGLPVPENFSVGLDRDPREMARTTGYPCVLEPLGLSASRGVIRANSADEFVAAFERIRRILIQPEIRQFHEEWNEAIQIEQYIEGREFAREGLMTQGDLNVLAIFDKPDPLEGPFFEETILRNSFARVPRDPIRDRRHGAASGSRAGASPRANMRPRALQATSVTWQWSNAPPSPLVPRLRRFRIGRLKGGFTVRAGDPNAPVPPFIDIRVAYDVRRGNPLRKYDEADFDLGSLPIRYDTEAKGVAIKSATANRMLIAVAEPDFTLDVTGFDPDRDLYVKAEVKEFVDVD